MRIKQNLFTDVPIRATRHMEGSNVDEIGSVVEVRTGILIFGIDPANFGKAMKDGSYDLHVQGYVDYDAAISHGWVIEL